MTILEKIERSLDFLKNPDNSNKTHELQSSAGILGQCMGILGGHPSISQYKSLLQQSIPVLLSLCCHNSAEIRLVADEALNRIIVGGTPYHSSRIHLHFHKSITSDKHPRWLRAALTRVYLGTTWLSAGTGNGRIFAQSILIRLKDIVERVKDPLLIAEKGDILLMECLEANLPRIMKAVSPYATRDEMFALLSTFITFVDSPTPSIRRNSGNCIADLCQYYQKKFIPHVINAAIGALQEKNSSVDATLGWFNALKTVFTINPISKLDNNIVSVAKYMTIYQICVHYIDITKSNHNVLNSTMDCLNTILNDTSPSLKNALLNTKGCISLSSVKEKQKMKTHHRSLSCVSMAQSFMSTTSSMANLSEDILASEQSDSAYQGTLLHENSRNQTPHRSIEDLSFRGTQTPDSPCESMMSEINSEIMTSEQFTTYVKEKLNETLDDREDLQSVHTNVDEDSEMNENGRELKNNLDIGNFSDEDVPLKYCARLITSRFLLSGFNNGIIPDNLVRVSVKAQALTCMNSIVGIYPQILSMYLSTRSELATNNVSGNSDLTASHNEQLNDFVLERNVCFQESMSDSFAQDLLSKSGADPMSQASGTGSNKSGIDAKPSAKREKPPKSLNRDSSLVGLSNSMLDSKHSNNPANQMGTSFMSGDSVNVAMTASNMTSGSQTTASNYPASTDVLTNSMDPFTSSLDLEMIFDHFGDSAAAEVEKKDVENFNLQQMVQEIQVATQNLMNFDLPDGERCENAPNDDDNDEDSKAESSNNNEDNPEPESRPRTEIEVKNNPVNIVPMPETSEPINQHISDLIFLFESHPDPQIRGLIRVGVGNFLYSVCDATMNDYYKWKCWSDMPDSVIKKMKIDGLLLILLRGVTDSAPQCINHSIMGLKKCIDSFCDGQYKLVQLILNYLRHVEQTKYWLCKVNLCNFYSALDFKRLCLVMPDWRVRGWQILDILIKFLKDQDHRVRKSAVDAIVLLASNFQPNVNQDKNIQLTKLAFEQNDSLLFNKMKKDTKILSDFRHSFLFSTLPNPMKEIRSNEDHRNLHTADNLYANLKSVIVILGENLITSQCKYYTQGCLEALLQLSHSYPPMKYKEAYCELGLLDVLLQFAEYKTLSVACLNTLLECITQLYSIYAWSAIGSRHSNKRLSVISLPTNMLKENTKPWNQFESELFSAKAENLFKLTLKFMNILIHIIQDAPPQPIQPKTGITLPPSPLKKHDFSKKISDVPSDDKSKRKSAFNPISGNFMPVGYFYNSTVLMKLYANLKAAYSTHKVSIDSSSSVFLNFMTTVIDCFALQIEFMSENEAGQNSEEILYYLKVLLPFKAENAVACVTQLVKCLFSVNTASQSKNLHTFLIESSAPKMKNTNESISFYDDVLTCNFGNLSFDSVVNYNEKMHRPLSDTSENRLNYKLAEGFGKNSHLQHERDCYIGVKNFVKQRSDKEWTTHKQEFSKYIKLFEPVVVQSLKCYTIQNSIYLQCKVLELMNQLLSLHINYCFLNSDGVFIEFVLKQLEFIERCEIFESGELVRYIFTFLVHLSTTEHHTKQLMDIPKLIQLCDGLMASEVYDECIQSLHPLAYKIFVMQQQIPGQSRIQAQEAQVTREVLFSMLQKMMRDTKVVKLITSVLIFSEEQPENHFKWSQLVCDSLFNLLKQKQIELNDCEDFVHLDKLFDCIHKEALYDQARIESVLRIMFDNPPLQDDSFDTKERWLSVMLLFLKKIIYNLAENEILLSLNYLKTSYVSPASIFFNSHNEIDPLNVQTVNENCANLSPDVIFVRFLFRIISYAILELENCHKIELRESEVGSKAKNYSYWCKLTCSLIFFSKEILYLKEGSRFPLLAKTAQTVLHNEQSGLNTGLYSPEENIPLKRLTSICNEFSSTFPIMSIHWCHLLVRLKFLEQKLMAVQLGFSHNSVPYIDGSQRTLDGEILQTGLFLILCEHFVDDGLEDVINLTWLLVNRIHLLIQYYHEDIVKKFVTKINNNPSASVLLLQAVTTRCQSHMKGTYGLKVYSILSKCHQSQSGALLLCICRFLGRLPISSSQYFVKLAIRRCAYLSSLTMEEACAQLPLDDVHLALEMLHSDRVDKKYPELVTEINKLACSLYNLSPLDLPLERPINAQSIKTTNLDMEWLLSQIKLRCYKYSNNPCTYGKHKSVANILKAIPEDELISLFNSNEFDVEIVQQTLRIGTEAYLKEFVDRIAEQECIESEKLRVLIENKMAECDELIVKENSMDSNIFTIPNLSKLKRNKAQSTFFVPIGINNEKAETLKVECLSNREKCDIVLPEFTPLLSASLKHFTKLVVSVVSLFPKNFRPLSHLDVGSLRDFQNTDKYTRRCFVVFRDSLFHQLILNVQGLVETYLDCLKNIRWHLEKSDCDVADKVMDIFLPKKLTQNLMQFSVISLQYTSFMIKQYEDSQVIDIVHNNSRVDMKDMDYALDLCISNASRCLNIQTIWMELNTQDNLFKYFSSVNCVYNYVHYILKDTLPLNFMPTLSTNEHQEDSVEMSMVCDRLITLVKYWQNNHFEEFNGCLSHVMRGRVQNLLISLCRCKFASTFILIPTCAWEGLELFENEAKSEKVSNDTLKRIIKSDFAIPIDILQDMDLLEQFLFRVNLIGWTNKKEFEEIWVSFLCALQGNGTHWAVRGMMQLLLTANFGNCGRNIPTPTSRIRKLKQIALDCNFYRALFSDANLGENPFNAPKYYCSQVSIDYLKCASGLSEFPDIRVQNAVTSAKKAVQVAGIDITSCIQLLMDIASQVLVQSDWGISARNALLSCIVNISDIFTSKIQWQWLSQQLSTIPVSTESIDILSQHHIILGQVKAQCVLGMDIPDANQLTAALSSSFAPTRLAALHSAIYHLSASKYSPLLNVDTSHRIALEQFNSMLEINLMSVLQPHLTARAVVSFGEQSLCWIALFQLIDSGNNEMLKIAIDFLFTNRSHFCSELLFKEICQMALKKNGAFENEMLPTIFKAVDAHPEKCHNYLALLLALIYSRNDTQIPENGHEPEQLLLHLQTFSVLQKSITMSHLGHSKSICRSLVHYLRDFLPPAAILNKVVQEFIDCCRWANLRQLDSNVVLSNTDVGLQLAPFYVELLGNVVFEVFDESINQDQLLIFNGWLFDGLNHFLEEKISPDFIPFCLSTLVTAASSNKHIRLAAPIVNYTLRVGCTTNFVLVETTTEQRASESSKSDNIKSVIPQKRQEKTNANMSCNDMRLLCLAAVHSSFTKFQLDKLKAICVGRPLLSDLNQSLDT